MNNEQSYPQARPSTDKTRSVYDKNPNLTLVEIGKKLGISKQRVYQQLRYYKNYKRKRLGKAKRCINCAKITYSKLTNMCANCSREHKIVKKKCLGCGKELVLKYINRKKVVHGKKCWGLYNRKAKIGDTIEINLSTHLGHIGEVKGFGRLSNKRLTYKIKCLVCNKILIVPGKEIENDRGLTRT